ncbi:hypothetical protein [Paraburkholderia terrae]
MKSYIHAFALCLFFALAATCFAEFVDNEARAIPLLKALAPALAKFGIDVRGGATSTEQFTGNRPRLAPLDSLCRPKFSPLR